MLRRLITLTAAVLAMSLLVASAASAKSPWWQLSTGARPSNFWLPQSEVQKLVKSPALTLIQVEEKTVACMGGPGFASFCPIVAGGMASDETAAELQESLEVPYGAGDVEVTEDPGTPGTFTIRAIGDSAGRYVPPISVTSFGGANAQASVVTEGGSGRLVITATNLGDAPVDGSATPVIISDTLPEGISAYHAEAFAGYRNTKGPVPCTVEAASSVSCTFAGTLPPFEAIEIEIYASLTGDPAVAGGSGAVAISGGNADAVEAAQAVDVSPAETPFGIESFSARAEEEGGEAATQAGSHPFQVSTAIQLNQGALSPGKREETVEHQPAQPRNLRFKLPAGLVGSATAVPTCNFAEFSSQKELRNECPADSAVGVASVTIVEPALLGLGRIAVPVFNLEPAAGEPARFGFTAAGVPVTLDASVRDSDSYRIGINVSNTSQLAQLLAATVTFWGVPGDPRHDESRGWDCSAFGTGVCSRPPNLGEPPLLRLPTSCAGPQSFPAELEPWNTPPGSSIATAATDFAPFDGCNQVPFGPEIAATAASDRAESPSGLDFELTMPQDGMLNPLGIGQADVKKAVVTLPEGMTLNPSAAEGLGACSAAEYARAGSAAPGCPSQSNVGTVEVESPLVDQKLTGFAYVAQPHDNPAHSLLGVYLVVEAPQIGVSIKLFGRVEPDPRSGRLVATFEDLPQLPFSRFSVHFREGQRAPLVSPPSCGSKPVTADLTPWSTVDPGNPAAQVVHATAQFGISTGVDGGPCPAGMPPLHPDLVAGTVHNAAGSYSPFNLRLSRHDSEQEFSHLSLELPPGVLGKLAGIRYCSEAGIAAARARTGANGAEEELAAPSCPAASKLGRALVGAGVGPVLTYVPGQVYLAGPYRGSRLSVVAIVAAKVGPFDLGTVVVREALKVDPDSAEVSVDAARSDPIPHILQGIPVHARDIRVYADRPDFVLNPTSCRRTATTATVRGAGLDLASEADDQQVSVTSPFQAADCASLRFKPRLGLSLLGPTARGGNPRLKAVLTARRGEANIARAQVGLPHSEFLDQSHIRTVCTRAQFAQGAVPGGRCPAASIYGHARAITPLLDEPIVGPVFLRSSSHELPDLVAALHSDRVDIDLVGRIDSVRGGRIRATFEAVPDAPVTKFTLLMRGGRRGLLVNSTDICRQRARATVLMTGHNGRQHRSGPLLKSASCARPAHKRIQ